MKTIYKYALIGSRVLLPLGAQILSVQVQNDEIMLWAIVDTKAVLAPRWVRVYGTGHELPDDPGKHLGTVQTLGLVWHVFEAPTA